MKIRKVYRYYCDHCKKSGGQRAAMVKHERGCVRNPDRQCGFCAVAQQKGGDVNRRLLKTLVVVLQECGLERLKKEACHCPACVFAAIVQSREQQLKAEEARVRASKLRYDPPWFEPKEGWLFKDEFDFRAEAAAFWKEIQDSEQEHEYPPY